MATLAELQIRLESLNSRIAAAEKAQQYTVGQGDVQVRRGDLAAMYAEREKLERRIDTMSGGMKVSYGRYSPV